MTIIAARNTDPNWNRFGNLENPANRDALKSSLISQVTEVAIGSLNNHSSQDLHRIISEINAGDTIPLRIPSVEEAILITQNMMTMHVLHANNPAHLHGIGNALYNNEFF